MSCVILLGLAAAEATTTPNMNGDYVYWKTPKAPKDKAFPTNFMEYPGGVESFDAYHGPITSRYSEVWWTSAQDKLPADVVQRFAGKTMAIVGVEMDQVRKGAGPNGEDVPVPISVAYNHHHNTMITGHGVAMKKTPISDPRVHAAGKHGRLHLSDGAHVLLPVMHTPSATGMPTNAMFDDNNGGEYRKSLHVYAPPFAQLVESPDQITGIAMQIDTWNRDKMNLTGSPFVPGPFPTSGNFLAPVTGSDAKYSGLLECPLTSRVRRKVDGAEGFNDTYTAMGFPRCGPAPPFCVEDAVNGINGDVATPGQNSSSVVYSGTAPTAIACEARCAADAKCVSFTWISPAFGKKAWSLQCYLRHAGRTETTATASITTGWKGSCPGAAPSQVGSCKTAVPTAADCFGAAAKLPGLENAAIVTREASDNSAPAGCSMLVDATNATARVVFNSNAGSTACCELSAATDVVGVATALGGKVTVELKVSGVASTVEITLSGPADLWFGVGFDALLMLDLPYAIIIEGGSGGAVTERRLAQHQPGTLLPASVKLLSSRVVHGVRTVRLTRALKGASPQHYTFNPTKLSLNLISAVGQAASFGPHNTAPHGSASVTLWPATPVCVCVEPAAAFGQATGTLEYLPTGETVGFGANRCADYPRMDLINQRNPTCDVRTYVGGLMVCRHGWNLLDIDQEIPWPDQPLVYYKKFRVYFQEYDPKKHIQIYRADWVIGSFGGAEYDVPRCVAGTPTKECTHKIAGLWTPVDKGSSSASVHLASIHHHCHAPTCLEMTTYRNDTGEILCRTVPVYGGTGGFVADQGKRYDEPGYIAAPPCMWGRPEDGLEPAPVMNGVQIYIEAITNNTYGHHGEMAIAQAMLSNGPLPEW